MKEKKHSKTVNKEAFRGWNQSGVTVNANQALVVTPEQLEQIRQLRGVPEPEQLQERKNNG